MNNYPHETLSQTEISPDLQSQSGLEDQHQFIQDKEDIANEPLDDRTIIKRFACGKKRLVVNNNLRIDYAHNSLQLSTPPGELIAIHKIAARLHYILVKKDSKYSELIQKTIAEYQFIPIDATTAKRGFMRYQKYEIPEGYNLQYSPALDLWQTWTENQRQSTIGLQLDILILARSKWYRVQEMICNQEQLDIQTRLGLISLSLKDGIAWIAKLGDIPAFSNADLTVHHSGGNSGSDSEILGKIISKLAIESSTDDRDEHFDFYNTMSESFASQSQSSSLSSGKDYRHPQTRKIVASNHKEYLLTAAINVLEEYLEHGETTVTTEVAIDPQGNTIGEKTITTQRGCPKWAIEAAFNWE